MKTIHAAGIAIAIVGVAVLYVNNVDHRHTNYGNVCIHSHSEPYIAFVMAGDSLVPISGTKEICDEWEGNKND